MKKISVLFLVIVLFPSIVSAVWWNPFTWKIIRKTDDQTQILEKRVKELEEKLNQTATSTATTTKEVVQAKKSKTISTVTQKPLIDTTQSVAPVLVQPSTDYEAMYAELDRNYYILSQKVSEDYARLQGGSQNPAHYAFVDSMRNTINSDIRELNKIREIHPKPSDTIVQYNIKYMTLSSQYEGEKLDVATAYTKAQIRYISDSTRDYISANKERLYIDSYHIETARRLDGFDRIFGSKYAEQFRLTKTKVETIEFADSFLLDLQLNKWPIN